MARARTQLARLAALACAAGASVGWAVPESPAPPAIGARGPVHVYRSLSERARRATARAALGGRPRPDKPPSVFDTPGRADYYGGRVISNVQVVPVFWTTDVDSTTQSQIPGFLSAITASPYIDWLEEYDTIGLLGQADGLPGSNQHIGRGTSITPITIAPMNTATTLTDPDIQTELAAQLTSGALPAPTTDGAGNVNSLYMIEFPDAYSINLEGHLSCSSFCGYHFTISYGGLSVPYAVMPGIGGCDGNCGTGFGWETSIHSHELMEAITDTEVGFTESESSFARPLAWYDPDDNMELADICDPFAPAAGVTNAGTDTILGYEVQRIWSDFAATCVSMIPICDGSTTEPSCRPCTTYDDGVDCTGATPVCQTSTTAPNAGWCVGCLVDSTCPATTPICDTTSNTCRACMASDCVSPTPVCSSTGACVECDAKNQTACNGKTPLCDEAAGTCVGCLSNKDCSGDTPICDLKTNTCQACKTNSDCSNGKVCDTSKDGDKGQCVDCNKNRDCAVGKCAASTHTCVVPPAPPDAGHDAGNGNGDAPPSEPPAGSSGGCACRATPSDEPGSWGGFGVAVAVGATWSRRRRRKSWY